eukprot:scaffold4724_cov166-Amphora_coffeaeformis.AAC.7
MDLHYLTRQLEISVSSHNYYGIPYHTIQYKKKSRVCRLAPARSRGKIGAIFNAPRPPQLLPFSWAAHHHHHHHHHHHPKNRMDSLQAQEPKRSGRTEAWGIFALVVGGPLLLLAIFGKTVYQWVVVLRGYETQGGLDKRLQVWILLACVCISSIMTFQVILKLLEHVLISCSSFIVTQPVDCGRTLADSLSENFSQRYRYQIRGKMYYKTFVSTLETADPDCQLHVHPFYPQLARHQNQMHVNGMLLRVCISFFANICQLILFMYALVGLRGGSIFEYIFGFLFCILCTVLFLDFYTKQPGGGQDTFAIAPVIRKAMLEANKPEFDGVDSESPNDQTASQEMTGYVAAP